MTQDDVSHGASLHCFKTALKIQSIFIGVTEENSPGIEISIKFGQSLIIEFSMTFSVLNELNFL
jgi:hypothetical protein